MSPSSAPAVPSEAVQRFGLQGIESQLRDYLRKQRWFSAKEAEHFEITYTDVGMVRAGNPGILFVGVAVNGGPGFNLWFSLRRADEGWDSGIEYHAIADVEIEGQRYTMLDLVADPAAAGLLWSRLQDTSEQETSAGRLCFQRLQGEALLPPEALSAGAEQTNSALIGDGEFLKLVRRQQEGPSVELEMAAALQNAGFAAAPRLHGSITHHLPGAEPAGVGILYEYLHNGTDGWNLALTSLRDFYARAEEQSEPQDYATPAAVGEQGGSFLPEAGRVGEVTAAMHTALCRGDLPPAMRPERITAHQLQSWAEEMNGDLAALLQLQESGLGQLHGKIAGLQSQIADIAQLQDAGMATRIHGDYHLGQILRNDNGWYVLDLDGEPLRSTAMRRRRWSPLRDVAGMLRSFDYAASVALMERTAPDSPQWQRLFPVATAWSQANREAFWQAYWEGVQGTPLAIDEQAARALLQAFEIQKAAYEVSYELQHRAQWVHIPLTFLTSVG